MFLRLRVFSAVTSLFALVACASGQQPSQLSSAIVPAIAADFSASVTPNKDCNGVEGVTVTPCPITLTKNTKPGITVTVNGRDVFDSVLEKLTRCSNGELCYDLNRTGSGLTQWRVSSGRTCGVAHIKFFGLDSRHNRVGYAFLKVTNKYCP